MNKTIFYYTVTGIIVGILITPFIFRALWWPSTEQIAHEVADRLSIEVPSTSPTVENYQPGFWQKISAEGSLSTVAVQVPGRINTGLVLSADGLIATINDLVPAKTKPVVIVDGVTYDAEVVYRDVANHIAILKTDAPNLIASPLDPLIPIQPGVDLVLVGKTTGPSTLVRKAIVSNIATDGAYLDTPFISDLNGLKAINEGGKVMGISFVKGGKGALISSDIISQALNIYLESARK